jgi:hypothetical protein
VASQAVLGPTDVAQGYATWRSALGAGAGQAADWLAWRRAMWLWSVTWCAEWQARDAAGGGAVDALSRHVRGRVEHYLDPLTVNRVADGFDALTRLLRA